jgi:hypothetical protein
MYIDPAAGSIILQVVAAGVLAATVSIRSAREAVKRAVRTMFGRGKDR